MAQPASPGQAYQWFKNGVALPGATAVSYVTNQPGNYKVRISSPPCGLDTSAEVTVSAVTLPTATITAPVTQVCQGDTAWIQANTGAGFSYSWLLNGATVPAQHGPVLPAWQQGTYQCIVSNGGCIAVSGTVGITVISGPVVALSPGTDQYLCAGAAVLFSTPEEPGYSYVWKRDGVVIPGATGAVYSAAQAGSYQVIVSNPQCPGVPSAAVAVIIASALQLGNDTTVCAPGAFAIPLAAGGLDDTVQWSTGSTLHSIMVTAAGTYWVQVTNSCGISSDTIHIRTINAYFPNLPPDTLICNAASIAVLSVPALLQNVQWSTGSGLASISVNTPGLYWVTGVSPCGVLTDTVLVAFCPPQILSLELASDSVCAGDCASVSARVKQYPTGFLWLSPGGTPAQQGGSAGPVPVCYAAPGVYPITCIATNIAGADTMQTQVVVLAKPVPRFADTVMTAAYKTTLHLPACAAAQSADWYLGDSLVCENCNYITLDARLLQSTYHCVVRNGGCTDTCAYLLHVTDIPHEVWMPDAFTPNGDGRNEVFRIITDNPNIHSMELSVYDRWGARLYTGRNTRQGWDGTNNGHTASAGVYFWTLRYKVLGTDEVFYQKGDVTLLR